MREDISITIEEAQRQASTGQFGFDGVFFTLPPWHRDDLGVIFPRLLLKNGRDEQFQI